MNRAPQPLTPEQALAAPIAPGAGLPEGYDGIKGVQVIQSFVDNLSNQPGVYRMLDEHGSVLYVGKARALKRRVVSYTRLKALPTRIKRMVSATRSMEFVITRTETEALLLEANLIKKLKPRYNVLLRDDKSFPYIRVIKSHPSPRLIKHRGARTAGDIFFGPFASASAVNHTVAALQKAFLLRSCNDSVFEGRSRPCLQFQIKRCSAPCTNEISSQDYDLLVDQALAFLNGKSRDVQERLTKEMETASESMAYEKAAELRDRLSGLSAIHRHQSINPAHVHSADVFGITQSGGRTCIQVFFYRVWQNWGNRSYFPRAEKSIEAAAVLGPFLAQFYLNKPIPRLILISEPVEDQALLEQALSEKLGRRVRILVPQRGEKRELMDNAVANAHQALARQLAEATAQHLHLEELKTYLDLAEPIRRVEIYDNSHLAGDQMVGGMVVAGRNGFHKQSYRKFNIKSESLEPGDDFGMMREVLTRRFTRLIKEKGLREAQVPAVGTDPELEAEDEIEAFPDWPDLIIIDGGKGQLSATREVLKALGLESQAVIAVSKGPDRNAGRENIHVPGQEARMLKDNDPLLYFIQRMRDEAHRFVIGAQRTRRQGTVHKSALDEISGVGKVRKRALLRHFGSVAEVKQAGLEDLCNVAGVDHQTAERIYRYFHE